MKPAAAALAGPALAVVVVMAVLREVAGLQAATWLAAPALVFFVAGQWPRCPRPIRILATVLAVAAACAVPFVDDLGATILAGFRAAAFFAALFAVTGLLRGAAEGSPLIRRAGTHLIRQPSGLRYGALTFGANLFGLLLSFGSLQLLGAMVQGAERDAGTAGEERARRERRALTAILRGFANSPTWSPFSISLALGLTYAPGATWQALLPVAFATGMALLLLGCAFDALAGPGAAPPGAGQAGSWWVQVEFVALVGVMFFAVWAAEVALAIRLIDAVVLMLPVLAFGWLVIQRLGHGPGPALRGAARRLGGQVVEAFPGFRTEVTILVSAALAGTLVAAALPADAIADAMRAAALPGALVPVLVLLLVVGGGLAGLNPVVTVTIVGAALPAPAALGADPVAVAAAYMAGWGLAVGSSPFALTTLIVGRMAGESGARVGLGWNGRYTAAGIALVALWLVLLSLLRGG